MRESIPKKTIVKLYARAEGKCERCGSIEGLSPHHKKFRSRIGDNSLKNLALLCYRCHRIVHLFFWKKGNEWAEKYRL